MGEVYRARDPRLGRDVAVKVVRHPVSVQPGALARFEREARAVAALSHPNILAIHDFGTDNGITYAVSELLDGETLARRIASGCLPWRKAVPVAIQIAEGLAAAHAHGIVHRDLKPDNVFLTSSGTTKILDFGVARVLPMAPASTASPICVLRRTAIGSRSWSIPSATQGRATWWYGGLRAVTLDGRERIVAQLPESVHLHDIASDGRVLLSQESRRVQIALMDMADQRVRDLSWLTWSLATAFTPDGRNVLFTEFPQDPAASPIAALRPVDSSPVVRLGEGFATGISPDGRWALAIRGVARSQIVLLPTGPGEPRLLSQGGVENHATGIFLPNGRETVFIAQQAGHGNRLYRQPISDGDATPISPEGVGLSLLVVSPDGLRVAATGKDGRPWLFSVAGDQQDPIPGGRPGEIAAGWAADGRSVYLRGLAAEIPLRRVNVRDGSAETVCLVRVPDASGVRWIGPLVIAPDGQTIAFSYFRMLSTLYLTGGLE